MRYKVGDKVRIKTWKQMKKEFRLIKSSTGKSHMSIDIGHYHIAFNPSTEIKLNKLNTNRIVTIAKVKETINNRYYIMKEISNHMFDEKVIKNIVKEIYEPICSRLEILDL